MQWWHVFWKEPYWQLGVALLGVAGLLTGGGFLYQTYFKYPKYAFIPADPAWTNHLSEVVAAARQTTATPAATLYVEVAGAVQKPGVYVLEGSARVQDALLQSGGFLPDADLRFVHQDLNLAATLQDQQKIYVPFAGEEARTSNQAKPSDSGSTNLNLATKDQLLLVEGVGEKRANDIIQARPYADWVDFENRSGMPANITQLLQEMYAL